jgi:AmmeMemoRadiSam system protein A
MSFDIDHQSRHILLATARESIQARLAKRSPIWPAATAVLHEPHGAFVTLHQAGALRGCIGRMHADMPLIDVVRDMAVAAAFEDPRFPPLNSMEYNDIDIEISVLSAMEPCHLTDIIPGLHGAVLRRGFRTGVFLPQVASEQGWDRDSFLEHLCYKAGLPAGAHLAPDASLMRFTAVIIKEKDPVA